MKILCLTFLLTFASMAKGLQLREGYYRGKSIDKDKVELHLAAHPSRPGSFMALVINEGEYGYAYRVDPYDMGTYGMIPYRVLDDAMIGFKNDNPSLNLKVVPKKNDFVIQIVNNGDLNKYGFKYTTMEFEVSDRKRPIWKSVDSGWFRYSERNEEIQIGTQGAEGSSSFTANTSVVNGAYHLREVKPLLNLPLRSQLSNEGIKIDESAEGMVAFLDGRNVLGRKGLIYLLPHGKVHHFKKVSK